MKQCILSRRISFIVVLSTALIIPVEARAADQAVGFNDPDALRMLYGTARMNAAYPTTVTTPGNLIVCENPVTFDDSNAYGKNYWLYQQTVWDENGYAYVVDVDEPVYQHYHLSFEDRSVGTCTVDVPDGRGLGAGRLINNQCVAPDWAREWRYLTSHLGDAMVEVRVADWWTGYWVPFDAVQFANISKKNQDVEVWVLGTDWNWYFADLAPAAWAMRDLYVDNIYELLFTTSQSFNPFSVDSLWLRVPGSG